MRTHVQKQNYVTFPFLQNIQINQPVMMKIVPRSIHLPALFLILHTLTLIHSLAFIGSINQNCGSWNPKANHHHRRCRTSLHADVEVGTTNTSNNNDIPNAETTSLGNPVCEYKQLTVPTTSEGPPRQEISVEDLTPMINQNLAASGMKHGTVTVISRHTTTAITINERESRLAKDMAKYFKDLAPIDERSEAEEARAGVTYFHNDIDERPESEEEAERCRENGWDIDNPEVLQAWRNQEPINAHSHLLSMLIGSSESIPVVDGKMVIGQWQSILLVDLDGPRDRTVGLQLTGFE